MGVLGGIGCGLVNGITGMIPGLIQGTLGGLVGLGVLGVLIGLLILYEFKKHAILLIVLIGLFAYLKFFACA